MSDTVTDTAAPAPLELPRDPNTFWRAAQPLSALQPPSPAAVPSALERLGPSPFPKSKFPFLGFLATVYDHVASCMDQKRGG